VKTLDLMMSRRVRLIGHFIIFMLTFASRDLLAQKIIDNPSELKRIDVEEHLGAAIPLGLEFTDEAGKTVTLRQYFKPGRPVLLTLAYYRCPMLCSIILNGISDGMKKVAFVPAKDYQIVTVSIDPRETYTLAAEKKENYTKAFDRPGIHDGWAFLVGKDENIHQLAATVGFKYFYDSTNGEYAHPAVSYMVSPEGKITRYLYGFDYREIDLRLGLMEAARGEVGTTVDRLILSCYHYDPLTKRYSLFAITLMRIGGVITLSLLALVIGILWKKELNKKKTQETSHEKN
jgi:protein SCO1